MSQKLSFLKWKCAHKDRAKCLLLSLSELEAWLQFGGDGTYPHLPPYASLPNNTKHIKRII